MGLEIGGITYGLQERDNTNDRKITQRKISSSSLLLRKDTS